MIGSFVLLMLVAVGLHIVEAGTSIKVASQYTKKEINIKIHGSGVGGCDVILQPGQENNSDCWCLWGTLNYSFCAYTAGGIGPSTVSSNTTVGKAKCPIITGESLLCSDLTSLGNCYNGAYSCTVDANGLCHCQTV